MTNLKITNLEGLMSVSSFFELGELENMIDVLALYRCKTCGFASPVLDSLSEHITSGCSAEGAGPVIPQSQGEEEATIQEDEVVDEAVAAVEDIANVTSGEGIEDTDVALLVEGALQDTEELEGEQEEDPDSKFEDFRCGFCPERFVEYDDLASHQNAHIEAFQERKHTASTSSRPRRQRRETKNKPLPCPLCPLEFVSGIDELQQHFTCHVLGRKGFLCAYCDRPAKSWVVMLDHLNSSHILAKTEQKRTRPDNELRNEVDFDEQLTALSKIMAQGSQAVEEDKDVAREAELGSSLHKVLSVTTKNLTEKVDLPLGKAQRKRISRKIYTLEKVKRGRGRPRKYEKRVEEVVVDPGKVVVSDEEVEGVLDTPVDKMVERQKRGRGRPRKNPVKVLVMAEPLLTDGVHVKSLDAACDELHVDAKPTYSRAELCLETAEEMDPDSVAVAMETDTDGDGRGEIGKLFEAVEIAMKRDSVDVATTQAPDATNPAAVQVVRASHLQENETHIHIIKAESRVPTSEDVTMVEKMEASAKSFTSDDSDANQEDNQEETDQTQKITKPVLQTYFLYPNPGGGYSSAPLSTTTGNSDAAADGKSKSDEACFYAERDAAVDGSKMSCGDLATGENEVCSDATSTNTCSKQITGNYARETPATESVQGSGEVAAREGDLKGVSSFCPHCVLKKGSLAEINLHISSHIEGQDDFQCTLCNEVLAEDFTFSTWAALREHYELLHKEKVVWFPPTKKVPMTCGKRRKKPYKCHKCVKVHLRSLEEVKIHQQCHVEGKNRLFRCPTCGKETNAWHAMVLHLMDHNDGKSFEWQNLPVYKCHICGKIKKTKTQLNIHINRGHFRDPRKCSHCAEVFTNWSSWRRHEDIAHTEGSFKCDHCPFVAAHSIALRNHMRFHSGKAFKCSECNYSTWNGYTLKSHKRLVHHFNGERVICDLCGKTFKTKASLIVHEKRKHQKQEAVRCEHCEFVTTNDAYLKAHIAKKHAPKPYQCQLCPYGTMTESVLQSHMRMHTENRPYPCPYTLCFFRARDQKTLASHIKNSHTDDNVSRRFPCSLCGHRFKTITMLKNHMPLHTGEKPHKCSLCDFRGKHRSTVHRHIKTAHCDMFKKSNAGARGPHVQQQSQNIETVYIEVPQETNYVPIETQQVLDDVTSQQVASIVAFENGEVVHTINTSGSNTEQIHGIDTQNAVVPTVVQEVEATDISEVETVMVVPVDQAMHIQEVIVESQVASADVEILKHLMELASTNP